MRSALTPTMSFSSMSTSSWRVVLGGMNHDHPTRTRAEGWRLSIHDIRVSARELGLKYQHPVPHARHVAGSFGVGHSAEVGSTFFADRDLHMDTVVREGDLNPKSKPGYRRKGFLVGEAFVDTHPAVHLRTGSVSVDSSVAATAEARKRVHFACPESAVL